MKVLALALCTSLAALAPAAQAPAADPVREAFEKCDVPALKTFARAGDLRALKTLVIAYEAGSCGLQPDAAEAFRWEKLAAAKGDVDSAARVGFLYLYGEKDPPVAKDAKEAATWLAKAGEGGHDRACDALSRLYRDGAEGLSRDPLESRRWWALGRDAAEMRRVLDRARGYRIGYDKGPKDLVEGVERISKSASKGTREDLYCLGQFYLHGPYGFPRDEALGLSLISRAAEKGDWDALLYLGLAYRHGVGRAKDPAQARIWLKKGSDAGHPRAQAWLGEMLVDGEGGPRDLAAAEPLLRAAAEAREPVSGLLYRIDLEKDYAGVAPAARKPPVADLLWPAARDRGAAAAEAQYRELLKTQPEAYDFDECWLNYLGYRLLDAFRSQDAVDLFRLNALAFPRSSNVWDSLAEALAENGQTDEAIVHYKKALAMNPQNQNAAAQIARLEKAKADAAAPGADSDWEEEMLWLLGEDPPAKEAEGNPPPAAPPPARK